ncbi:MAG: hypothetical protein GY798_06390 [Hyphomicrobiales bacterium]|nr:hypothetical protein [Hyphomicrobiales bacterium]
MSAGSDIGSSRGAILRLFGVILIILGALDIMLSWRGGFEVFSFHVMLFVTGQVLYVIGAIRRRDRPDMNQSAATASGDSGGVKLAQNRNFQPQRKQ